MRPIGSVSVLASTLILGLFLVLATGCTKEEVAAPGQVKRAMKSVTPVTGGNVQGQGGSGNNGGVAPITDDGDDVGDNERSKPKPKV